MHGYEADDYDVQIHLWCASISTVRLKRGGGPNAIKLAFVVSVLQRLARRHWHSKLDNRFRHPHHEVYVRIKVYYRFVHPIPQKITNLNLKKGIKNEDNGTGFRMMKHTSTGTRVVTVKLINECNWLVTKHTGGE